MGRSRKPPTHSAWTCGIVQEQTTTLDFAFAWLLPQSLSKRTPYDPFPRPKISLF